MTSPLLAEHTTLRVGGPADEIVTAATEESLVAAVAAVWDRGEDPLVVGGGSNLLVGDDGYDGTVVLVRTTGIRRLDSDEGRVRLRVQAGENWDALVAATVESGWSGIEALSGIPGSVGAAPIQNIGAYGQDVAGVLVGVTVLDRESGDRVHLDAAELALGYRTSVLKRHGGLPPVRDAVVLSVDIELVESGGRSQPVAYEQLARALGVELGAVVAPAEVRSAVLALRASKGMVLDAADPDTRSAGSFFTNPTVPAAVAAVLPASAPRWPVEDGTAADTVIPLDRFDGSVPAPSGHGAARVKLSAAWLIENAGIPRGFALPRSRAAISSKHTLALTNHDGATAAEVAELARFVVLRVRAEFGVDLVPEPVTLGVEI
ncbi:UDP-N-acetylmuramate dehydrogenase [Mycetocola reblochoni]|uniref:UDP-N-acetylenolpyruvoylglucosamine reductase n=2 Tax=Mycetocola reblochoni TaxID=331618 RepID=A0A1R4JW97_9MICO|nr:UDP-N-acetylmuramate dehydrogenase [Mycetocola reblochoni]RLP70639.1 UDP-N-acetylmuramate dehydrogenase [Mycetocola reblochoni]SJN36242.1 UDP-N-acetylenolpyruvoylglucosamine reductase [Mycetocola reblochoni REB411]